MIYFLLLYLLMFQDNDIFRLYTLQVTKENYENVSLLKRLIDNDQDIPDTVKTEADLIDLKSDLAVTYEVWNCLYIIKLNRTDVKPYFDKIQELDPEGFNTGRIIPAVPTKWWPKGRKFTDPTNVMLGNK